MVFQLLLGSLIISLTIIVQVVFMETAARTLSRSKSWFAQNGKRYRNVFALVGVTLWLMASHSLGVWFWAATFLATGAFEEMEPALYFSVVSFTTLGFGDILLPEKWRLLSGLSAANGLLIFGISTAFLVEFMSRLRRAQEAGQDGSNS